MRNSVLMLLLFLCIYPLQAQNRVISGTVVQQETNEPLPGVSIIIKGTTQGTTSDLDGKFSISVTDASQVLVFSYVGHVTEEIAVGANTVLNVSMVPDIKKLDEIVVVGYGVQKKSLLSGAISKVNGNDLVQSTSLHASQILQGKVAGVVISNSSGQPGSSVSVRIRGIGSNGDSNPLYIVDGLPLSDAGLDFLNQADIESMEVLKDAASCAVYGTRGANGVIIVTTKKGKTGSKQVTYEGYYGLQNPWRKLDVLNSNEYMMLMNEAAANANKSPVFSSSFIANNKANTDWQDEMFYYNAPIQSHAVSLSGGDENGAYISSFSYLGQDGIVAKGNSNFKRFTYRLDANRKFGLLEVGSNLNFANITNKGIDANNQYGAYSLIQALNTPPIVPVKNDDGSWGTPSQPSIGLGMQEITNPVAMLSFLNSVTNTNKVVGDVYASLDFAKIYKALEGLKFRSSFNTEYTYVNVRSYTPLYYLDATHQTQHDGVTQKIDRYITWNLENVLTYNKTFEEHHFTLMLGQSAYKYQYNNIVGTKNDVIFNDLDHAYLDNAQSTDASTGGGYNEQTLSSFFGRLNYELNEKYLLTLIMRRDGSSRFGKNKYATFPSVSGGWVISRENFMSSVSDKLNFAKLRASWGKNGNQNIGDFRYTTTIGSGSVYYFGSDKTQYNGTVPVAIPNPEIKWEASEQTNIGLDLGFFQSKLSVTLDYYIKSTKNWLIQAPVTDMVGNNAPTINAGNIRNSGFEFECKYRDNIGKFTYEISAVGGYNKNKVTDIPNIDRRLTGGNGGFGQYGIIHYNEGEPAASFYGVKTNGIFQNSTQVSNYRYQNGDGSYSLIQPSAVPGDVIFVDQDNNGKIDDADRVNLGSPFPDFTGGLNIYLSWKGIDLSMFWYTSQGNKIWDATRRYDIIYSNYRTEALNRWIGEGTSNYFPRVTLTDDNGNWNKASDLFVKDASFTRLRNLTLGYTLPKAVTSFVKIQKFRVFVSGENLLTFTKYKGFDPEIGGDNFNTGIDYGNYPQARTIRGGINITF